MRGWRDILKLLPALLCALLCLTGCGEEESAVELSSHPVPDSGGGETETEEAVDCSDFDWRSSEWKRTSSRGKGEALYIGEYIEGQIPGAELAYDDRYFPRYVYRSFICGMDKYTRENGETCGIYLYRYDADTGESIYLELDVDSLLGGEGEVEFCPFDMRSEEEFVFLRVEYEEGHFEKGWTLEDDEVRGLTAVHVDVEGNLIKTVDLYPGVTGSDYLTDMGWGREQKCKVDSQGNYYFYASHNGGRFRKMVVLDPEGQELCVVNPYPEGLEENEEWGYINLAYVMKDPDGFPVFYLERPNRRESVLLTFDRQKQEIRQTRLPYLGGYLSHACMDENGMCYFVSDREGILYRWNLCTGGILELMDTTAENLTGNAG